MKISLPLENCVVPAYATKPTTSFPVTWTLAPTFTGLASDMFYNDIGTRYYLRPDCDALIVINDVIIHSMMVMIWVWVYSLCSMDVYLNSWGPLLQQFVLNHHAILLFLADHTCRMLYLAHLHFNSAGK
jgi:hypothetical protein